METYLAKSYPDEHEAWDLIITHDWKDKWWQQRKRSDLELSIDISNVFCSLSAFDSAMICIFSMFQALDASSVIC